MKPPKLTPPAEPTMGTAIYYAIYALTRTVGTAHQDRTGDSAWKRPLDLRPPAQLLEYRLLQATAKKIKDDQAQEAAGSDRQPSQHVDSGNFLASL